METASSTIHDPLDMPSRGEEAEDLTDKVDLKDTEPVFMGPYSCVYKGLYQGREVAIKIMNPVSVLRVMKRKFRRELLVLTHVDDANIVPFYGYTDGSGTFGPIGSLIFPWYNNGHATKFLLENGSSLSMEQRIDLWRGVISGVRYLHNQDPQIIHGDLKPANILIDDDGNPRICDFGLVYMFLEDVHKDLMTTSPHTGTERYRSPELLYDDARPSVASDIWALGCIGLEFLYSIIPYQHRKESHKYGLSGDIRKGVPPAKPPINIDEKSQKIWQILGRCWCTILHERPDTQNILDTLSQLPERMDTGTPKEAPKKSGFGPYSNNYKETSEGVPDTVEASVGSHSWMNLTNEISIISSTPEFVGSYSYIYKGTWRGQEVAIKVIRAISEKSPTMQRKFLREITAWADIKHENIAPFYGFTDGTGPFSPIGSLVSPWYRNGDATAFLDRRGPTLSLKARINLWRGVVSGVSRLHEYHPMIVHGDLKPSNILIDDNDNPRICDFGLVRIFQDESHSGLTTTSPHTGTDRYLAPELLEEDANPTPASDMWALGCIGLVFIYSTLPYQHINTRGGRGFALRLYREIREGALPASPPKDIDEMGGLIWRLLRDCWHHLPDERHHARTIQNVLVWLVDERNLSEQEPIPERISKQEPDLARISMNIKNKEKDISPGPTDSTNGQKIDRIISKNVGDTTKKKTWRFLWLR